MTEIAAQAVEHRDVDASDGRDEADPAVQPTRSRGAATVPTWRRTVVRVSVLYTAVTLVSSGYALASGQVTDTHVHLLLRFGFVVVGIGVLDLYDLTRHRWPRVPPWVLGAGAYLVGVVATMSGMWLWGAAGGELHPDAFRDGFLNFTGVGVVLVMVIPVVDRVRSRVRRS